MDDLYYILNGESSVVAPLLLGSILERKIGDDLIQVRIVETEAYDQSDTASHSYAGKTQRNEIMFGEPGHLYVYFTYGMYYCCNVVVGPKDHGSAVLIRAVEPVKGEDAMSLRRGGLTGPTISNGPAKLCQALNIDKSLNGHDLKTEPLKLIIKPGLSLDKIVHTQRIGISKGQSLPWRFYISGNKYVSKT